MLQRVGPTLPLFEKSSVVIVFCAKRARIDNTKKQQGWVNLTALVGCALNGRGHIACRVLTVSAVLPSLRLTCTLLPTYFHLIIIAKHALCPRPRSPGSPPARCRSSPAAPIS